MYELPKCYAIHLSAKQSIYYYVPQKYRLVKGRKAMRTITATFILIICIITIMQAD